MAYINLKLIAWLRRRVVGVCVAVLCNRHWCVCVCVCV